MQAKQVNASLKMAHLRFLQGVNPLSVVSIARLSRKIILRGSCALQLLPAYLC